VEIKKIIFEDNTEHKSNKEFVEDIIETIFTICMSDTSFTDGSNTNIVEEQIGKIDDIIMTKQSVLSQSDKVRYDIKSKISNFDERNHTIKSKLFTMLGATKD